MEHDQHELMSYNEVSVADVFHNNDNFISSFIPSHENDSFSNREILADGRGYAHSEIEPNLVQANEAIPKGILCVW